MIDNIPISWFDVLIYSGDNMRELLKNILIGLAVVNSASFILLFVKKKHMLINSIVCDFQSFNKEANIKVKLLVFIFVITCLLYLICIFVFMCLGLFNS
jgi:hypothetical protein